MSDLYKIIQDPELRIPIAAPLNRYKPGISIDEIFKNQLRGSRKPGKPEQSKEAPKKRRGGAGKRAPAPEINNALASTIIDVVKNYDWSVSPKNDIVEHPYIYLTEFRMDKSPLLAQMAYLAKALTESSGGAVRSVTDLFKKSGENEEGGAISGILSGVINFAGGGLDKAAKELITQIEKLEDRLTGGAIENEFTDSLQPYSGMYYRKETGFVYKLPYFVNKMAERSSSWQKSYPGSTKLQELLDEGFNFVANYGAGEPVFGAYGTPGMYIERPKYFNPTPDQDPLQFNFPLLNTLSEESMQRNFDLVWLLSFQNSSIRRNKVDVYPPCIYTAHIPGIRYMLYCNIQNLSIEYLGTRRRVSIVHPVTESALDVIVPEAYNLTFTINNLTTESGNLMLKSLTNV